MNYMKHNYQLIRYHFTYLYACYNAQHNVTAAFFSPASTPLEEVDNTHHSVTVPSSLSLSKLTAPPQEVSIVSTSYHSFTMTWTPPPKGQQNGEIVSYEVEYREEDSNSTVVNTTRGMRYTAEDLTTNRVYQFRVAANTVNGTGPLILRMD